MNRISLNELHEEILQRLTQKDFIKRINLPEEKIQSLVLNKTFITKLSILISKENITCEDVKELSTEILNSLSKDLPKDWLEYVHEFVLYKSFPNSVNIKLNPKYDNSVIVYLEILRTVLMHIEKLEEKENYSFNSFIINNEDELEKSIEFQRFKKVYIDNYIYELIKLNHELTNSDLLYKIEGVWNLSMQIARSLSKANVGVKLWLVCCTVIGHYMGYYALRSYENFNDAVCNYSGMWFEKFDLSIIGNTSTNYCLAKSNIEHFPIESLILTYANLRVDVKNSGKIYYTTIENISKNLEENYKNQIDKKNLYIEKIKDFEGYLASQDVNIKYAFTNVFNNKKDEVFLQGNEVIDYFKNISVDSNIKVMKLLCEDSSFDYMIEMANGSKMWKDIIIYLNIFDEYTLYLNKAKRLKLIEFLYGLLNSKDGEIRKLAAKLLGKIIALFDTDEIRGSSYTIEETSAVLLWKKYLDQIILSNDINDRENAIFYLHDFINSFIQNTKDEKVNIYVEILLNYFEYINDNEDVVLMLLTSLPSIDITAFSDDQIELIFNNIFHYLNNFSDDIRLSSLNYIYAVIKNENLDSKLISKILEHTQKIDMDDKVGINFLKFKILLHIDSNDKIIEDYNDFMSIKSKRISEIFLINLKAATKWTEKIINIDFILDIVKNSNEVVLLHSAAHLCNLVKVSAKEVVRYKAGKALLSIGPFLTIDQRNEISIELIKGLEIDEFEFSKYIPDYLGRFILLLHPKELDEGIKEIQRLYKESNKSVSSLALKTLSIMLEHYSEYECAFEENSGEYNNRLIDILSIIVSGLVNNEEQVRMDTLFFIGSQIFNSKDLSDNDKFVVFKCIGKKILNLIDLKSTSYLYFLNSAISLNFIYRFLNNYYINNKLDMQMNNKVAYFCNSFDPFTLEHKRIIDEIKKQGFDIYLDIDEFCWWKNTQPYKIRKKIIDISIADEFNTYLFPENLKINIANPSDLAKLKNVLSNKEVYIVIDDEMLLNDSIYKQKPAKNSVYSYNHIIYSQADFSKEQILKIDEAREKIKGNIIEMNENLKNNTKNPYDIRENINNNKDISSYVDSEASKFIHNTSMYLREPKDKSIANKRPFKIEIINDLSDNIVDEIGHYIFMYTNLYENIGEELVNKNISLLVIRENSKTNKLLGFSAFHHIGTAQMFHEFKNIEIANYVRENTSGKIIIIDGMYTNPSVKIPEFEQTLLTETLLYCLKNDFTYALYCNTLLNYNSDKTFELLVLHGFKKLNVGDLKKNIYAVDMKFPICLTLDIQNYIKEPLISSQNIKDLILDTRKRLKSALTKLYPNSLVLSFDVQMLQQALVEKVCELSCSLNKSNSDYKHDYICVPFGNVLNGKVVPNIPTKSLHIEKLYNYDIRNFEVSEYPFYSSIYSQIDVIKSFDKPIILVDDVMHNCHEIVGIDPILKSKNVDVKKIVVGILSSNGKDIMEIHDRKVESAYFIPNLRLWLRESMLYPFFGGNSVFSSDELKLNLIPSINHILPYVSPSFVNGAAKDVIYDFSMLCLENAKKIFKNLELEYKNTFDKNLVLRNLCEVVKFPRYPVKGENIYYDLNKGISFYVENDIKNLIRIEQIVKY